MILNCERDALIRDLVIQLHDFARENNDDEARDLADCIEYMRQLWRAEGRQHFRNGGRVQ